MRRITGKILDCILLIISFALFMIVLPDWVGIIIAGTGLIICIIAMISNNFFGRFWNNFRQHKTHRLRAVCFSFHILSKKHTLLFFDFAWTKTSWADCNCFSCAVFNNFNFSQVRLPCSLCMYIWVAYSITWNCAFAAYITFSWHFYHSIDLKFII